MMIELRRWLDVWVLGWLFPWHIPAGHVMYCSLDTGTRRAILVV